MRAEMGSEFTMLQVKVKDQDELHQQVSAEKGELKKENLSLTEKVKELDIKLAVSLQKIDRMEEINLEIQQQKLELSALNKENLEYQKQITEFKTRIEDERKGAAEKLKLLNEAKNELKIQFKAVANDIFDEKGKKFSENNKEKLNSVLAPFNEQLKEFRKKVDDVYVKEATQRASLKQELLNLQNLNQKLNQEAINLTRALKGDKKTQGNWGELILERVLEQSGLRKGIEYETQGGFRDEDNNLLKPDVIIHLPEGKDIIVDSKVSLSAYEQYSSSTSEEEQAGFLSAHVAAISSHVNSLSDKDYSSLTGIKSLDFVLMFIPIEPAFMIAFQQNEKLFSEAFKRKITVVTPTTLLATLRTIENIWRYERQNR
ncbi:MAG: DNA recombination protein RmuC, partial [Proteobacteria bacterium]|nr:DNA recombination protein RmuC [Pseudomonadota bacterium]